MIMDQISLETVGSYVIDLGKAGKIAGFTVDNTNSETPKAVEVGGGNLNYSYIVSHSTLPGGSVFVKHAPNYIKCLGPEYKLTQDRVRIEAVATADFNKFSEFSTNLLFYDESKCTLILEDLRGYSLLRDVFGNGFCENEKKVAQNTAQFISELHLGTLRSRLTKTQIQDYEQKFENEAMCGVTLEYVFTKPFQQDETNNWSKDLTAMVEDIHTNSTFCARVAELKKSFSTCKTALVHGDLHTGSIMVDKLGNTRIIDAEFAFYGPPEFDVALVLAGFCFTTLCGTEKVRAMSRDAIDIVWNKYFESVPSTSPALAVGFCGCEMMRRIIGAASWPPVSEIENETKRISVEKGVLEFGKFCVGMNFDDCTSEDVFKQFVHQLDHIVVGLDRD